MTQVRKGQSYFLTRTTFCNSSAEALIREFFMLDDDVPFDENSVPPWTRGDFRGV